MMLSMRVRASNRVALARLIHSDAIGVANRKSSRTYEDAVSLLNSTQSGFKVLEERRRLGIKLDPDAVSQMRQWLRYIGYSPSDLNRMNIVHVAGTKGKGTTCAFTNSILQRFHDTMQMPRKIGLYTSPHLVSVRERIRIGSEPISEEQFAKYFFEVWNAFEATAKKEGADPAHKPNYFRFLTLMSFHVFMREGVDAAIYEVGVGGELDSTNVIEKPAAVGITTLGIDHVITLGDTVDKIAWHKAGIMKLGCPAFTTEQVPEAMEVLERRAQEKNVKLVTVPQNPALDRVAIVPAEDFQRKNASVAIELAYTVLDRLGVPVSRKEGSLPEQFVYGLENVTWRARCETKVTGKQRWYLDGAHNEQSLEVASNWFGRISRDWSTDCALIFNQQSTRDSIALLKTVYHTACKKHGRRFRYAVFCPGITYKDMTWKVDFVNHNTDPETLTSLTAQQELADTWHDLDPTTETTVMPTIEDAIDFIRTKDGDEKDIRTFITGSFHLVGGALSILEGDDFALASTSAPQPTEPKARQ